MCTFDGFGSNPGEGNHFDYGVVFDKRGSFSRIAW